jgi:hypothetical protein
MEDDFKVHGKKYHERSTIIDCGIQRSDERERFTYPWRTLSV